MNKVIQNECKEIVTLLEDHKAENIIVFHVEGTSSYADDILLVTAPNERALEAYRDALIEFEEAKGEDVKSEGKGSSGWIIVDCGNTIVHLLLEEKRNEIALEELLNKSVISD